MGHCLNCHATAIVDTKVKPHRIADILSGKKFQTRFQVREVAEMLLLHQAGKGVRRGAGGGIGQIGGLGEDIGCHWGM